MHGSVHIVNDGTMGNWKLSTTARGLQAGGEALSNETRIEICLDWSWKDSVVTLVVSGRTSVPWIERWNNAHEKQKASKLRYAQSRRSLSYGHCKIASGGSETICIWVSKCVVDPLESISLDGDI